VPRAPAVALVAVIAACATAPARPPPAIAWPAAPAAPRVRLVATLPGPPEVSRWRRVLDAIVGLDPRAAREPLQRPFGVAIAPGGDVIVVDPDAGEVFRLRGGSTKPLACRGRAWSAPMAVTVAPDAAILVADAGAAEIVRVAPDGKCTAIGTGALERPTGVAADAHRIFVADPPRHEIVVFSPAGVVRLGRRGEGTGEFDFPTAAARAPDGTLLVVDALNFRIVRLSPGGDWLASFGRPGDEGDAFARPKGIAVAADGRIFVSDAQRDLVLVFREDGAFEYAIGGTGTSPGWFTHPAGLAIAGGRLYVADSHNRRIQVFEILGERS
jgi:DNA-binding beta-propeller fold protein YncE